MDFTSRILTVIIGTILANSGDVLTQGGGGGIAVGLGDMMADMPILAMAGEAGNQQLNPGRGGLMGGAPGSQADGPADSRKGVLTGSNGAPVTNMAGVRMSLAGGAAGQPSFGATLPVNAILNRRRNMIDSSFLSTGRSESNLNRIPSGTFIIGAGQPNASIINSNHITEQKSLIDTLIDSGRTAVRGSKDAFRGDILSISNTKQVKPKGQSTQNFAVDLSAFAPRSFEIPALNVSSFDPNSPEAYGILQQANGDKRAANSAKQQIYNTLPTEPVQSIGHEVYIDKQSPQDGIRNTNVKPLLPNTFKDKVSKPSHVQEIINVQPGWANSLFPMDTFTTKPTTTRETHFKTVQPDIVNVDAPETPKTEQPLQKLRNNKNLRAPLAENQIKPVVGSIFGGNNPQQPLKIPSTILHQARVSSAPSVDFMTSFLNNPNLNTNPIFNNVSSVIRDRDAKAVDQFGVADIYTRKQKLDKGQWENLLSLVTGPNSGKRGNKNNIKYETMNANTWGANKPFTPNRNRINQAFQPGFLKHRGDASTSIRTMFKAPGVSGFSREIGTVFTVPLRQEFVASNPTTKDATKRVPTKKPVELPMFQQAGIQRNLVAAPDSGSTRAFDTSLGLTGQSEVGASQASSAFPPQQSFNVGKSVVVGNSLSPELTQALVGGTPIALDSTNLNAFASTGLRLGQPVITSNTRTPKTPQSVASSDARFMNRESIAGSQMTAANRDVVFGTSGAMKGRALGVKSAGTTPAKPLSTAPSSAVCKYRPDPTSRNHFIFEFRGFRHRFRCALGTAFDAATCECSTLVSGTGDCLEVHMDFNNGKVEDSSINRLPIGVQNVEVTNKSTPLTGIALFGDNSKLTIWRYQNFDFRDHILLKVQFRPGSGGGRFQPLISNCDSMGGAPSVAIVYDSKLREVLLMLQTDNDTSKELTFPVNPNEWNDVTYIYDGQEFIGIVNGVRRYVSRQDPHLLGIIGGEIKSLPTTGLIEIRDAALVLGFCPRWGHYMGAMVDIQVYTCIPRDFRLE